MFAECAHCGPKTCEDLGYPIPCAGGTSLCNPECVCIDGFVRDANGTCILKEECRTIAVTANRATCTMMMPRNAYYHKTVKAIFTKVLW
ncbi:Protease inhibitor 3 [Operophtera brumata]|uniref:Protease inhibitor 3 n=1 Tax=Operophtera brumata TaxID=104452 RepID=A0A0L7LVL2_OPEBR|nr:Protease inhibitor 3 [Operophtera brumata]